MDPIYIAVAAVLVPVVTQGLKWLFNLKPEAKGWMKVIAAVCTGLAAAATAAGAENSPALTELLIGAVALFFAQDGIYNTVLKPIFAKLSKEPIKPEVFGPPAE